MDSIEIENNVTVTNMALSDDFDISGSGIINDKLSNSYDYYEELVTDKYSSIIDF